MAARDLHNGRPDLRKHWIWRLLFAHEAILNKRGWSINNSAIVQPPIGHCIVPQQ
jgi:hypothetical protein